MIYENEFVSMNDLNEWLDDYPFSIKLITIQKIVIPAATHEMGFIDEKITYIVFFKDKD